MAPISVSTVLFCMGFPILAYSGFQAW